MRSADTVYDCGTSGVQQCREVPDVAASADPAHGDIVYWRRQLVDLRRDEPGVARCGRRWWPTPTRAAPARPASSAPPSTVRASASVVQRHHLRHNAAVRRHPAYPARVGYDLATGWGSPRAAALLGLLSGSAAGCPTVTGAQPVDGPGDGRHHRDHHRDRASAPVRRPSPSVDTPAHVLGLVTDLGDRDGTRRRLRGDRRRDGHHHRDGGGHQPGGGRRPGSPSLRRWSPPWRRPGDRRRRRHGSPSRERDSAGRRR